LAAIIQTHAENRGKPSMAEMGARLPGAYPRQITMRTYIDINDIFFNDFNWLPGLDSNQRPFD
jgi:hypothetical protein